MMIGLLLAAASAWAQEKSMSLIELYEYKVEDYIEPGLYMCSTGVVWQFKSTELVLIYNYGALKYVIGVSEWCPEHNIILKALDVYDDSSSDLIILWDRFHFYYEDEYLYLVPLLDSNILSIERPIYEETVVLRRIQ
jgi:hypothetical protein